jgi:hypothetical protein
MGYQQIPRHRTVYQSAPVPTKLVIPAYKVEHGYVLGAHKLLDFRHLTYYVMNASLPGTVTLNKNKDKRSTDFCTQWSTTPHDCRSAGVL